VWLCRRLTKLDPSYIFSLCHGHQRELAFSVCYILKGTVQYLLIENVLKKKLNVFNFFNVCATIQTLTLTPVSVTVYYLLILHVYQMYLRCLYVLNLSISDRF